MVGEGIQSYVDMAAGVTKATRAKATAAAKNLLSAAGLEEVAADASDRVNRLTEEIIAASRANRELMGKLIAAEVDKNAARLGFVRAEELDDLRRELSELRMSMAHAAAHEEPARSAPTMPETVVADPRRAPVSEPVSDPLSESLTEPLSEPEDAPLIEPITEPAILPTAKSAAKKAAAKKAPTAQTAAKKTAAKKAAAKRTAATTVATKTPAPSTAKKTAAKRSAANKSRAAATAPAETERP